MPGPPPAPEPGIARGILDITREHLPPDAPGEVEVLPVHLRCCGCSGEFLPETLTWLVCGGSETTMISGIELQGIEIELADTRDQS